MQLYAPTDLERLQRDLPYLIETTKWVRNFLAKPHPDLGRTGPVCPFLPKALQLESIQLATVHTKGVTQQAVEDIVRHYRDTFLELEPRSGDLALYKCLLLVFPDVSEEEAPVLIDNVQQKLKPFFVEQGLMIGEFHQRNATPGLHNPNFYPLRSPVPMLAIRFMTESDLPFLQRTTDEPHLRTQYLEAYLQSLTTVIKDEKKLVKAQEALAQARLEQENSLPSVSSTDNRPQLNRSQSVSKCPFAPIAKFFGRLTLAWGDVTLKLKA